jgi:hypothetical protein
MANESGIRVEALSGAPEWAREDYRYIPHSLLDFIFEYNRENPDASFSGVHFDIEPYGVEEFEEEGEEMMAEYVFLAEELVERVANEGGGELTLGFAVPYWYVGEREDFPTVRFDGEEKEVGEALIEILDSYEHSYIAIMAYRVEAEGNNGTVEISKPLLREASEGSRNVSVYIGQETAETEEESISFFGSTKESFNSEARQIDDALQAFGAYEGIVIHHLESFLELN